MVSICILAAASEDMRYKTILWAGFLALSYGGMISLANSDCNARFAIRSMYGLRVLIDT